MSSEQSRWEKMHSLKGFGATAKRWDLIYEWVKANVIHKREYFELMRLTQALEEELIVESSV
jgi:hypothetical protein